MTVRVRFAFHLVELTLDVECEYLRERLHAKKIPDVVWKFAHIGLYVELRRVLSIILLAFPVVPVRQLPARRIAVRLEPTDVSLYDLFVAGLINI